MTTYAETWKSCRTKETRLLELWFLLVLLFCFFFNKLLRPQTALQNRFTLFVLFQHVCLGPTKASSPSKFVTGRQNVLVIPVKNVEVTKLFVISVLKETWKCTRSWRNSWRTSSAWSPPWRLEWVSPPTPWIFQLWLARCEMKEFLLLRYLKQKKHNRYECN